MITHDLKQGTAAWLAYRAQHFNASDAPAMMGCSIYRTRAELLRERHTGVVPDVSPVTQRMFDAGHRLEDLARPLAEEFIGAELYPVTGSLGKFSASFDGLTMDERQGFEHKHLNAALKVAFAAIRGLGPCDDPAPGRTLPLMYRVQMEQQLLVSGAERILFMASDWTAEDDLIEEHHCWYNPDAELRQQILDGWEQFERDLAAYVLPEPAPEPARAEPMESLPAVSVRLDGALSVAGNLPTFAVALRAFIDRMPTKPATDTEFATCDAACKALKKAEEALDAAEAGALASITDVEAMRRAVADCRKLARDTRLAAEKMVDRRKVEIKEGAVMAARRALDAHVAAIQAEIAPMRLQPVQADFAGAIKGLRSLDSMQGALDGALAAAKIAADAQARNIRANVAAFNALALADDYGFLFADLHQLVHKAADDFGAVVRSRIAEHKAAEAEKERKRKADEDARVAAAEAKARADEAARIAEQQRPQQAPAVAPHAALVQSAVAQAAALHPHTVSPPPAAAAPAPAPRADEPATLKLGAISGRLGFTVSAAFLADALHIQAAGRTGASVLYRESQWPVICRQLIAHVGAMAELYTQSLEAA